jgi:8-oxo-dGTP pyrophosphatase MutT (NUDIX family)
VSRSQTPTNATPAAFSAGVVVVRRGDAGWRLLVLRAWRNWDFPKGRLEPNEAPLDAAIRETAEESSIADLVFHWGEAFCETAPYAQGKVARYYLAETKQERITLPISPELGYPEHNESRWVSFDEAERLLPPRLQPILEWVRRQLPP